MDRARTILVFGATGQQGGSVARALREGGWSVRAFVRDPASAPARSLAAFGCSLAPGDLADPETIEAAMMGAYGVFSVQPSSGQGVYGVSDTDEVEFGSRIANAAQRVGVSYLVYSSIAVSGTQATGLGHFDSKLAIEQYLRSIDVPATIVRPSTFMELLMLPGMGLDEGYVTFFTRPDQKTQFIAVEDIGRIVAAVFAQPKRFIGETFEIAGDVITGQQVAYQLSLVAEREIIYQQFSKEVLAENDFLGRLASLFDSGRMASSANMACLRELVPNLYSFADWLRGPGKPYLESALHAKGGDVHLR